MNGSRKIKMTTSETFENVNIIETLEPVTANAAIGMNVFKDFLSGITDFVGGHSNSYQKALDELVETALGILESKVMFLGGNGIIGLRIDTNEISGKNKSMIMVTAYGTAALYEELIDEEDLLSKKIKDLRVKNIINHFDINQINNLGTIDKLRLLFGFSTKEFNTSYLSLVNKRKKHFENDNPIKLRTEDKNVLNQIQHLIDELKEDEMIVEMKADDKIEVIKKSKYEMDLELHLTNYTVVYLND